MGKLGSKLRTLKINENTALGFWCPGCKECHIVTVNAQNYQGASWTWDGNIEAPTFSPSILVTGVQRLTEDEYQRVMRGEKIETRPKRCHSFVRAGRIEYLTDCLHELAGTTVEIPPLPETSEI